MKETTNRSVDRMIVEMFGRVLEAGNRPIPTGVNHGDAGDKSAEFGVGRP